MRNPRDFFKPLAIGAPDPATRDPVPALADDPLPRRLEREDGGEGARHGQAGRHPARQPRGRDPGRPQGRRARGPDPRRRRRSTSATPSSGRASTASTAPGCSTTSPQLVTEIGDKLERDHGPEGRGAVGHPLRGPAARAARGEGRPKKPLLVHAILETSLGRREPRGDRDRQPAHAGHELRPRRPGRLAPHEDDARRRRPPRLPRDRGPRPGRPRQAARNRAAGPVALLDRAHGRRLHLRRASSPSTAPTATSRTPRAARRSSAPRSCSAASAPGRCTRRRSRSRRRSSARRPTRSSSRRRCSRRSPTAAAST